MQILNAVVPNTWGDVEMEDASYSFISTGSGIRDFSATHEQLKIGGLRNTSGKKDWDKEN